MTNILADDPTAGAYLAPDSTEILARNIRPRKSIFDDLLYRMHSVISHWHAVRFQHHWRAASRLSRRVAARAIHDLEASRADPNRPA